MLVALCDFFLFIPTSDDPPCKDRLDLGVATGASEGGLLCFDVIGVIPVMYVLDVAILCNFLFTRNY